MTRSRSPIAIDFGEHSVKALQLERRGGALRVREAQMERVVDQAASQPDRRQRMTETGRRLLRKASFRGKSAIVALRLADVSTRHIRVPTDQLDRQNEILAREVQAHTANTADELSICPIPVADIFDRGAMKREFLGCVATAPAIQELIEMTEALGLVPEAIDLEPCAQVRPYLHRSRQESFLLLDIGTHSTRITVVRSGATVLMRTTPVGGAEMLAMLQARLQMDLETILDLGGDPADDHSELEHAVTGALAEHLEGLLQRVAAGVRYCGALFQGRAVTLLRVTGGIAALPGLVPYLGRRIGITAEVGNPFAGIEANEITGWGDRSFTNYGTALGLALRGVQP